jgi:branched-chain amino acid transport system permease protein
MLIRAAAENRALIATLGINQGRLFTAVFALGAFLAGLAGALQLPREPANLGMDLAIIADAFVVTVVGGLGSIPGAFLAAALIGVTKAFCIALGDVDAFGVTFAFPKLTLVVEFLIMAIVLALKPQGLLGKPRRFWSRRRCPSSARWSWRPPGVPRSSPGWSCWAWSFCPSCATNTAPC